MLALSLVILGAGPGFAWGDEVERPFFSGWHSWKYNTFSSYDQLRINIEKDFAKSQKFFCALNGLLYQEDNTKSWKTYIGETTYKLKAGKFDFIGGLLVDTIGSGDKISFIDKINSRRYYNGLANDYNRDKKEVPGLKTTFYHSERVNLVVHYLPYFYASEIAGIFSQWATAGQRTLGMAVLFGAGLQSEPDHGWHDQFHLGINTKTKKYELRYHYLRLKERLPVVEAVNESHFRWTYPLDETFAIDGNVTLTKEWLVRFELAWNRDKTFGVFQNGRIGRPFRSDQINLLLGTDQNLKDSFYWNMQWLVSHIRDFKAPTPFQLNDTEVSTTIQLRKGFKSETMFIEFNGVQNLSTGEYILTPQIQFQKNDYLKFIGGVHLNGRSTDALGPIGQFDKNNTPFFETQVVF
jgi:hypothetical protein